MKLRSDDGVDPSSGPLVGPKMTMEKKKECGRRIEEVEGLDVVPLYLTSMGRTVPNT